MIKIITVILIMSIIVSCGGKTTSGIPIIGSWQFLSGTTIEKNDTIVSGTTGGSEMIKIINETHFAFFKDDFHKYKDSSSSVYSSGGGRYTLVGNQYTEYLDYCDAREWEGHIFNFKVTIKGDTLIQEGIERIESLGIVRVIIEQYKKIKKVIL